MKHSEFIPEHEICKRTFQNEWTSLTTRGVLSRRLLPVLWKAFQAHSAQLELLMVKFGLFLPFLSEETDPEEQQYLVPALLPHALRSERDAASDGPGHTFIVLFGSERVVARWRRLQKIRAENSAQEGFMPNGLWAQVLNGIVAACQLAHGCSFDELELAQDEATVVLGHCHLTLQRRPQLNGIAVCITDGDPRYVLEWFQDCVSSALHPSAEVDSPAFSRIRFLAAVPQGAVNHARLGASDDIWKQDLVLLQSEKGVEATLACRGDMRIGRELLSTAQLRERFKVWLEAQGPQASYHAFVSYRWTAFDMKVSGSLYSALNRRRVNNERVLVFRDQERLMTGLSLQDSFCSALARSTVALPIVSPEAVEKFARLDSNANIDNVHAAFLFRSCLCVLLCHDARASFCCWRPGGVLVRMEKADGVSAGAAGVDAYPRAHPQRSTQGVHPDLDWEEAIRDCC